MANRFRINFHHAGFDELRRSAEVLAELEGAGNAIADQAGGAPDFLVESELTQSRARVVVYTATIAGRKAEAQHRKLTRALDAGRK